MVETGWLAIFFTNRPCQALILLLIMNTSAARKSGLNRVNTTVQTSLHWLENTDLHKDEIIELFRKDLGEKEAKVQWPRWRIFFMACEECFNFNNGSEWLVDHYRFTRKSPIISEKSLSQEAA